MRRRHGLGLGALVAILIAVLAPRLTHHVPPPPPVSGPAAVVTQPGQAATRGARELAAGTGISLAHPEIGFRSRERWMEHFAKHGGDFPGADAERYLRLAQGLRDRPAGGDVLELRRDDGAVSRYDRASGAFLAFDADLTIRTFFKPNDGEAYFRRQAERMH
jgi:hypothetical protein